MRAFAEIWARATVAELNWLGPAGPEGMPVVPLVLEGSPCVALPYSQVHHLPGLVGATTVFSVTDQLSGGRAAALASGSVEVTEDPQGKRFVDQLLEQEVVKYPPSRLRIDSLMARRENWWWVPRILVRLHDIRSESEVTGRTRATDALAVRAVDGVPHVQVLTADDWPWQCDEVVEVFGRDGAPVGGRGEPTLVYSHQYSPDFERWERWHRRGRLRGERLHIEESEGQPLEAVPPLRFLERYLNHRQVARACRAGIATAEAAGSARG